ncbi:MAG: class I SAM-dependent methyltransferase [Alphaproteobacteria bacterium]|nr:class I SAM-dependent methyltransferase [Alphaproteobacteria bacterium]
MKLCLSCQHEFSGHDWACPGCGFAPEERQGFKCFSPELAEQGNSFDVKSFEGLARVEEKSFWFPPRNRLILWALGHYFPHCHSFMEMGCGTGYVLKGLREAWPNLHLLGTDIYVEGLATARKRLPGPVELIQADGMSLPFRNEFDVVGAFDVVEHIDDDVGVLQEMARAVRPGGGVMVIVPQHKFMWSRVDDLAQHKRRYSRRQLNEAARKAGLQIIRTMTFAAWTFPFQMASRMLSKQKGDTLAEVLELHMHPLVHGSFKLMLDAEFNTLRRGVNYPFGASLMLVARRPLG